MTLDRQLRRREGVEEQGTNDDGMTNLRQFMAILRDWDREDRMRLRELRGQELARRCFTDDMESD